MSSAPLPTAPPTEGEPADRPLGGLVKHSAIYSAAPILRQLISIGMTRLYTGWLGSAGYGVKENVDLWLIALQQLLGQNVLAAMVRFYFEQKSERERGAVVSSCVILTTLAGLAVCGLLLLFVPSLTPLFLSRGQEIPGSELESICLVLLLLVPFQLGTISGLYYLQALKRSGLFTAIQTVKLLLEVGLNFYLMGSRDLGVRGFLLSMLIGEVVTSTGLVLWMLSTLGPRFDRRLLAPVIRYAAPLVPVGILQLMLHNADKRIVLELAGQSGAGVYGFGYKISYLVTNMMLGPFIQIWQPWIFGVREPRERARLVARVGTYSVLAISAASLGVILFGRQAAQLLSADRTLAEEAYPVIPFVAAGYVFWALYHVSQTPLFLEKRTAPLLLVNALAVALNLGLNAWLVRTQGILGAAIATLATFAVLAAMGMIAGRRSAGVTFELGRLGTILSCVAVGGCMALWIDRLEDAGRCALALALLVKGATLAGLMLFFWTWVLSAWERERFTSWVGTLRRSA